MDDFEAALAAKVASLEEPTTEPEATVESEPEVEAEIEATATEDEATEEPEPAGQPRDEQGRFIAAEEPERPAWLPDTFKSAEELARSWQEAQTMIGRQAQEVGELRQMLLQHAQQQAQPTPPQNYSEALSEDPEQVAMYALKTGNQQLLDQAVDAWYDEDPRAAARFEREIDRAMTRAELAQQITPTLQQIQRDAEVRSLTLAQRELRSKYPDMDSVLESLTEADIAGLDTNVVRQLQAQDPKAALELVYRWVTAGRPSAPPAASPNDEAKQRALEQKRQAVVASSSASPGEREKSSKELLKEFMLEPDQHSVLHGLSRE